MYDKPIQEARRQVEICNACRYCEGYCSVFPTITSARAFSDGDITHLANLCHNCRGCYYACQYTDPHEFDLNLPKALAEVRHDSWKQHAWPVGFSALFDRAGVLIASLSVLVATVLFYAIANFNKDLGHFYFISANIWYKNFNTHSYSPLRVERVSFVGVDAIFFNRFAHNFLIYCASFS